MEENIIRFDFSMEVGSMGGRTKNATEIPNKMKNKTIPLIR
jgi:hypothetical protein